MMRKSGVRTGPVKCESINVAQQIVVLLFNNPGSDVVDQVYDDAGKCVDHEPNVAIMVYQYGGI